MTFAVNDPEVLQSLAEYPEGPSRTNFLVTALRVGVLSLKAARGTVDSDTVRREGDRLIEQLSERLNGWRGHLEQSVTGTLSHYFDPQQGTFVERVDRLVKDDGDLVSTMRNQVKDAESSLSKVFEQFVGENSQLLKLLDPSGGNQLIASMQRTLESVVQSQNTAILGQFSLDNRDSALTRFLGELSIKHGNLNDALSKDMQGVVAEFSLDKPDSALSRLVTRVEEAQRSLTAELSLDNEQSALKRMFQMLQDHQKEVLRNQHELSTRLDAAVQSLQSRREEADKSTRHGLEFEASLASHLRTVCNGASDILEETGATTGMIPHCKVGDHVITLGPEKVAAGARIVIEAKESASYDLSKSLAEADTARRNRQANVCVFVHSTKTASPSIPAFARYGQDLIVKWDAESSDLDVWLQAALMVATALSAKAAERSGDESASFDSIDEAVEEIRKHIGTIDEIITSSNTIASSAAKIKKRADILSEGLGDSIARIQNEFVKVKHRAGRIDTA